MSTTHVGEQVQTRQIPVVAYLSLDPARLTASACKQCGARYFDRRNACANCGAIVFDRVDVATEGTVRSFTIVAFAAPGVEVPFVSAIIDCRGTSVRANLVNVAPDAEHVHLGMQVRLTTFGLGCDESGTEAVGFGFEPA